MTTQGMQVMDELFKQIFNSKNLNANKLVKKKYGGHKPNDLGYSQKFTLDRRKHVELFAEWTQKTFEIFKLCVEDTNTSKKISEIKQLKKDKEDLKEQMKMLEGQLETIRKKLRNNNGI